jgi:Holliday junction resolvase RusA-like endonuclease
MHLKLEKAWVKQAGRYVCRAIPHNMSNQRFHWIVKSKWARAWKDEVKKAFYEDAQRDVFKLTKAPFEKSKVEVVFYACRLMDRDGAYHAAKPIIDGLTEIKIIADDSEEFIDLKVSQIKVKHLNEQRVEIEITKIK